MANSDYSVVGTGQFCPVARLMTGISPGTTVIGVSDVRMVEPGDVAVGVLILIGDEIMQIVSLGSPTWTVKRGCLDTIPMGHEPGQTIFVIDRLVGSNFVEYLGTQTISVKLQAKAVGGVVPIEYAPPHQVTFNQRFARPYPPANFRVNNQPWYLGVSGIDLTVPMTLTWNQRNRVLQADQVLGHTDATVPPEDGTSYEVEFYTEAMTKVATVSVPAGQSKTFDVSELRTLYGLNSVVTGTYSGVMTLASKRDGLRSMQNYAANFEMNLTVPLNEQAEVLFASDSGWIVRRTIGANIHYWLGTEPLGPYAYKGSHASTIGVGALPRVLPHKLNAVLPNGDLLQMSFIIDDLFNTPPYDRYDFAIVKKDLATIPARVTSNITFQLPRCLTTDTGRVLLFGDLNKVYSTVDGTTWTLLGTIASPPFFTPIGDKVNSDATIKKVGQRFFAFLPEGFYYTDHPNALAGWTACTFPANHNYIRTEFTITQFAGSLYVIAATSPTQTNWFAYKSVDNGQTWTAASSQMEGVPMHVVASQNHFDVITASKLRARLDTAGNWTLTQLSNPSLQNVYGGNVTHGGDLLAVGAVGTTQFYTTILMAYDGEAYSVVPTLTP